MEQQLCDRAIRLSCHPTSKEKFTAAGPRCEATPKTLFDPRWLRSDLKADTLRHSGCCSGGAVGAAGRGGAATANSMAFHKAMV